MPLEGGSSCRVGQHLVNALRTQTADHEEAVALAGLSIVSSSRWISFPLIFLAQLQSIHHVYVNSDIYLIKALAGNKNAG